MIGGARSTEAQDPDCRSDAEAVELLRGAPWRRLVVVGDSVAAGTREPTPGYRDASGTDRLAEWLARSRRDFRHWNLAQPGLRLAEVRAAQLPAALDLEPDLVVVAAGGNDALARDFDPEAVEDELRALLRPLAASGALVVTLGLFDLARSGLVPSELAGPLAARFDRLDDLTRDICVAAGGIHVENHAHPRSTDPGIFAGDRIHANARGHAISGATLAAGLHACLQGRTGPERGMAPARGK
jgi:lysophospholipase L1-like esterase